MDDPRRGTQDPWTNHAETVHEAAQQRAPWTPPTLRRIEVKRTSSFIGSFLDGETPTTK